MPGLFEALSKMPKRGPKKHFITVDGKQYEVSHEKHQWAVRQGFDNLIIQGGEIVLKPVPKVKTRYSVLAQSEKGYFFEDNDIHWPNKIADGGVTWQIKSE